MNPYDRGADDCGQDACENAPFASVGGLDARRAPTTPPYVLEADRDEYLRGYEAQALAMYGADWRTRAFGWAPARTIEAEP